nr:RNA-directed DNA polymerase, eukaryota [Tanacetum cinerariifolium]
MEGMFERPIAASNYKGILRSNGSAPGLRHSKVQDTDAAALVLDESCAVDHDFSKHVMGKVKDAKSISNLRTILRDESFSEVNVSYLGGLWVLFECDSADTKANLMRHTGVLLGSTQFKMRFMTSRKWGEMLDIEDNVESSFGRKRLCVLTKQPLTIFESFKVIYKGKVLMVRAKKIVTWNPTILFDKEKDYCSDDESMHNSKKGAVHSVDNEEVSNAGFKSDVEGVAETIFEGNTSHPIKERDEKNKQMSDDPFRIYDILNKQTTGGACAVSLSLSHPPGFTPEILVNQVDKAIGGEEFSSAANVKSSNSPQVVFRMLIVLLSIWVSLKQEVPCCEALGFSGGILCVWEASVFKKDYATISDNFVAIYRTWLPSRWRGETVIMGDFNEVRSIDERVAFTWSHPSGSKMSKLDRLLVSEGIFLTFPSISALCLERHLSDHLPIILREMAVIDSVQKSKVKWAIEGDENLKFFHGIINKRRSHLAIHGVFDKGNWVSDPRLVKESAFIANRHILDGPFILNEILHWCKRKNKQAMFFKVDFAKAYDTVRWDYLFDVLEAFGFGHTWCNWICGTLSSARASVLVNGSPSKEFSFYCGLKQGDPCLKINIHKSQVLGVGIPRNIVMQAAASLGCGIMFNEFRYLGVMVGKCMSRHQAWEDVVSKLRSRLSKWKVKTLSIGGRLTLLKSVLGASPLYNMSIFKVKTLSIGGRLTLLKSVLGASPLYNMSIFKVPKGILKIMEMIRSNFFNRFDSSNRKITWATWDKILAFKKNGGLGVSSFHALNRALLLKWVWRFISQDGSLWFRVIHALRKVRKGAELQQLEELSTLMDSVTLSSSLDRWLEELSTLMDSVTLSSSLDRWVCNLSGDGGFRVSIVRNFLDTLLLPSFSESTRWSKYVPIKINIFTWRARRDYLPTRSNLILRGISLETSMCPLCHSEEEDIIHVLFRCDLAKTIARRLCRWWDIDWLDFNSFSDWSSWFTSIRLLAK